MPDMADAPKPTECSHPPRHRRPLLGSSTNAEYCSGCFSVVRHGSTPSEVEDALDDVLESDASAFM